MFLQIVTNSVVNALRAKPLTSGRVPIGVEYQQPIAVYNPFQEPLHVLEVYTSNDALRLGLIEGAPTDTGEEFGESRSWVIQPHETKTVMQLLCMSNEPEVIQGYVHVRTNVSDANVVISVKLVVSDQPGLYHGPGDSVDFGAALTVADGEQRRSLTVLSNTDQMLRVVDARVTDCVNLFNPTDKCPTFSINMKRQTGRMMQPNVFTEIGDAVLMPRGQPTGYFVGFITIEYNNLSDEFFHLHVPFSAHILTGSILFPRLNTAFMLDEDLRQEERQVEMVNGFEEPVELRSVTLRESAKDLFAVGSLKPTVLGPADRAFFELSFHPRTTLDLLKSEVLVWTNLSSSPFVAPLLSYLGELEYAVDSESPDVVDFGPIYLGEEYTVDLEVRNPNPVPIMLEHFTVDKKDIHLVFDSVVTSSVYAEMAEHGRLFGTTVDGDIEQHAPTIPKGAHNLSISIPPGHAALFKVKVRTETKAKVQGQIDFVTALQKLRVPVYYRALKHSVTITPSKISFNPTMPGRLLTPSQRKTSEVLHLVPPEAKLITMSPRERLGDITNIYSDDPRLVIQRFPATDDGGNASMPTTLASVSIDPTLGAWNENYVPQYEGAVSGELPELTKENIAETKRAKTAFEKLKAKKRTVIKSKVYIDSSNSKSDLVDVHGSLEPIFLGLPSTITFPLTQVKHVSKEDLLFTNPTQYPVLLGIETLEDYSGTPVLKSLIELLELTEEDVASATASRAMFNATVAGSHGKTTVVKPYGTVSISVEFSPTAGGSLSTSLLIRNNLTIVQLLSVSGEAGTGTFGFPKTQPYIVDGGLSFPLTHHNLSYCTFSRRMKPEDATRKFSFNVSVLNRGNMPVKVLQMAIGASGGCSAGGFTIESCEPFTLKPLKARILTLSYTPDFSTSSPKQSLVVQLQGRATPHKFHMEVTMPAGTARSCYDALPGPEWEGKFKTTTIISILTVAAIMAGMEWMDGSWDPPGGQKKRKSKKENPEVAATTEKISKPVVVEHPPVVQKEGVSRKLRKSEPKVPSGAEPPKHRASATAETAQPVATKPPEPVEVQTGSEKANHKNKRKEKAKEERDRSDSGASDSICRSDSLESDRSTPTVHSDVGRGNDRKTSPVEAEPAEVVPTPSVSSVPQNSARAPKATKAKSKGTQSAKTGSQNGSDGKVEGKAEAKVETKPDPKPETKAATKTGARGPSAKSMPPVERPEVLIAQAKARAGQLLADQNHERDPSTVETSKGGQPPSHPSATYSPPALPSILPKLSVSKQPPAPTEENGEFSWKALDNASGGPSPFSRPGPPGQSMFGGDRGAPFAPTAPGARPSWDADVKAGAGADGSLGLPSVPRIPPSPTRLPPPPESLRSVPKPPKTSLIPPLQRPNLRRAPPGLFDEEAPPYTSLPSIGLGAHTAPSGADLLPRIGNRDGPPVSWSPYAPNDVASPDMPKRGPTPSTVDTFAVDAAPGSSAESGFSSRQPFRQGGSHASAQPFDPAQSSFEQWGSSLDSYVPAQSPPQAPRSSSGPPAVDAFGSAAGSSALPSIPYAGVDSNNIWSTGMTFGELDWATTKKDKMDPEAREYSPW